MCTAIAGALLLGEVLTVKQIIASRESLWPVILH